MDVGAKLNSKPITGVEFSPDVSVADVVNRSVDLNILSKGPADAIRKHLTDQKINYDNLPLEKAIVEMARGVSSTCVDNCPSSARNVTRRGIEGYDAVSYAEGGFLTAEKTFEGGQKFELTIYPDFDFED